MEDELGYLRHAGYGLNGEVAERVYSPGVLEGGDQSTTIRRIREEVKGELSICLYGVDATITEKSESWSLQVAIFGESPNTHL